RAGQRLTEIPCRALLRIQRLPPLDGLGGLLLLDMDLAEEGAGMLSGGTFRYLGRHLQRPRRRRQILLAKMGPAGQVTAFGSEAVLAPLTLTLSPKGRG